MSDLFWDIFEGQVLDGKYHLRHKIGIGGYGAVFLAEEVVAGRSIREVVIKLFRVAEETREQQLRELRTSATLHHPNLIRYFAPGQFTYTLQGRSIPMLYLVMERAEESLEQRLRRGTLTPLEAEALLRQMCDVLMYLHELPEHWVHRDVKPANILWCEGRWKLADLGLMRELGPRGDLTAATTVMGTPAYAPPEAFRNYVTPAWDMWSLGVVLVEALTGRLPFEGNTVEEKIHAVLHLPPSHLSRMPEPFRTIAEGCLEKNPRERLTPRGIIALLDAPPKPTQTRVSWQAIGKGGLWGGAGLFVLRLLLGFLLPQGGKWHPLLQVPVRGAIWQDRVLNSWSASLLTNELGPYMVLGILNLVGAICTLYLFLNSRGRAQWLLFPVSLFISLLLFLFLLGGASFLFHVPLVVGKGIVPIITVAQQATLLGLRYIVLLGALIGVASFSLGDTMAGIFLFIGISNPAVAWGLLGMLGGGLFSGYNFVKRFSSVEVYKRWRIGASITGVAMVLLALLAQTTVFSNPTFIREWTWGGSESLSSESLEGVWVGRLEGRQVRMKIVPMDATYFRGHLERRPGRVEAMIEGSVSGGVVVVKVVPLSRSWLPERIFGELDASGKVLQGWEKDAKGRRVRWLMRRVSN